MSGKVMLPMGIENFKEIRTGKYYYVDKTGLIKTLLEHFGKVNLFTRPRRFGKTLNMSWRLQKRGNSVRNIRGNFL